MNAIISGEVRDTIRQIEQPLGPVPLSSATASEERDEDADAEDDIALFRNLKLPEATAGSHQHLISAIPNNMVSGWHSTGERDFFRIITARARSSS